MKQTPKEKAIQIRKSTGYNAYGNGKLDALEEMHNKRLLNKNGEIFYLGIRRLDKKGWFDNGR